MAGLYKFRSICQSENRIKRGHSRSSRYTVGTHRRLTMGFEALEDRRLLSISITPGWLAQQGSGPYVLSAGNTAYVLDTDVTVNGTAFVFGGKNITLDLNGHKIIYGNSTPISVLNGGFETGSGTTAPGWNLSGAPDASIAANTYYMWGSKVLKFTGITATETILSDAISIPAANREYTATVTPKGAWDDVVRLSVIDAVTGAVLGASTSIQSGSRDVGGGFIYAHDHGCRET